VTFHETFWVVTGTAAPVIALAAVVSLGEALKQELLGDPAVDDLLWQIPFKQLAAITAGGRLGVSQNLYVRPAIAAASRAGGCS